MESVYKFSVVREKVGEFGTSFGVPGDVKNWLAKSLWTEVYQNEDREIFVSVYVDIKNRVIGWEISAIGTENCCPVSPPHIFRSALISGAKAIIVVHNHPSGEVEPSAQDKDMFKRLQEGGEILGINVLDSIIVGGERKAYSLLEDR